MVLLLFLVLILIISIFIDEFADPQGSSDHSLGNADLVCILDDGVVYWQTFCSGIRGVLFSFFRVEAKNILPI